MWKCIILIILLLPGVQNSKHVVFMAVVNMFAECANSNGWLWFSSSLLSSSAHFKVCYAFCRWGGHVRPALPEPERCRWFLSHSKHPVLCCPGPAGPTPPQQSTAPLQLLCSPGRDTHLMCKSWLCPAAWNFSGGAQCECLQMFPRWIKVSFCLPGRRNEVIFWILDPAVPHGCSSLLPPAHKANPPGWGTFFAAKNTGRYSWMHTCRWIWTV